MASGELRARQPCAPHPLAVASTSSSHLVNVHLPGVVTHNAVVLEPQGQTVPFRIHGLVVRQEPPLVELRAEGDLMDVPRRAVAHAGHRLVLEYDWQTVADGPAQLHVIFIEFADSCACASCV